MEKQLIEDEVEIRDIEKQHRSKESPQLSEEVEEEEDEEENDQSQTEEGDKSEEPQSEEESTPTEEVDVETDDEDQGVDGTVDDDENLVEDESTGDSIELVDRTEELVDIPEEDYSEEKEEEEEVKVFNKTICAKYSRRKDHPGEPGVPIQYIHVPKAGGTTIQRTLKLWADLATITLPIYLHNGGYNWTCPRYIDRGIMMGHRGFGFCDKFLKKMGEKAFYIVTIREPVSHFRSFFDYTLNNLADQKPEEFRMWNGRPLSELVIEYNETLGLNLPEDDVRMKGPNKFLAMAKQQTSFLCGWRCVQLERLTLSESEMIDQALKNLERVDVVAIMERLDDLIDQMKFHVNWIPSSYHRFPQVNTVKQGLKSRLNSRASEIVASWSGSDIKLYEAAKRRHTKLTDLAHKCRPYGFN